MPYLSPFFLQYTQVDDFILITRLVVSSGVFKERIGVSTFVHIQWAKGISFFHHAATLLFPTFHFSQHPCLSISLIEAMHYHCIYASFSLLSLVFSLVCPLSSSTLVSIMSTYYVPYCFRP